MSDYNRHDRARRNALLVFQEKMTKQGIIIIERIWKWNSYYIPVRKTEKPILIAQPMWPTWRATISIRSAKLKAASVPIPLLIPLYNVAPESPRVGQTPTAIGLMNTTKY